MAGAVPDELLLARDRRERETRERDVAALRSDLNTAVRDLKEELKRLSAKLRALAKGQVTDSGALIEQIDRVLAEPGFAMAERITRLEAEVSNGQTTSFASIEEIRRVIATTEYALAESIDRLRAQMTTDAGISLSTLTTILSAYATTSAASSIASAAATAAVGAYEVTVNSQISALATADGRLSGQAALQINAGGRVAGYTITAADGLSGGSGYSSAPTVSFELYPGQSGSGAAATAVLTGDVVTAINVTSAGSGYTMPPKVVLTGGGGSGAKAVATILGGAVTRILTAPTSEVAFNADVFKIYNGASSVAPFTLDGSNLALVGTLVIGATGLDLDTLAENAAVPSVNFIGDFASAPSAGSYPVNSVYRNTTDGNLYVRTDIATWALYVGSGTPGASVEIQYSVDGSTSWHSTFTTGDLFRRERVGTGSWSAAHRIVGLSGTDGTNGVRGSKQFFTSGSSWSDGTADAAITSAGLTKVTLDQVTISDGATFAQTRYWDGSAWQTITAVVNGNLLVNGSVAATKIQTGIFTASGSDVLIGGLTINATKLTSGDVEIGSQYADGVKVGLLASNKFAEVRRHPSTLMPGFQLTEGGVVKGALYMNTVGPSTVTSLGVDIVSATQTISGPQITGTIVSGVSYMTAPEYRIPGTGKIWTNGSLRFDIQSDFGRTIAMSPGGVERWFFSTDGNFKSNGGALMKASTDGRTVPLHTGSNTIAFSWNGSQLELYVDGNYQGFFNRTGP